MWLLGDARHPFILSFHIHILSYDDEDNDDFVYYDGEVDDVKYDYDHCDDIYVVGQAKHTVFVKFC